MAGETHRLARSVEGRTLLGNAEGFVPLSAAGYPADATATDALADAAAGDLPPVASLPARPRSTEHVRFAAPFDPGKLWGIGLNYADHAADLDEVRPEEPASFMKPATTVTAPGGPIRLPPREVSDRVTAEAELGVVLGRTCKGVEEADFADVVAGFVPVIDMTAEDVLQRNPRFLTRAKSFDSFLVVGPWLSAPASVDRLAGTTVRTIINDEVIAENTLDRMLFSPPELVAFHSDVMTLDPGDLISTGTPGAGVIEDGDTVRAEVDGVGVLEADVVRES